MRYLATEMRLWDVPTWFSGDDWFEGQCGGVDRRQTQKRSSLVGSSSIHQCNKHNRKEERKQEEVEKQKHWTEEMNKIGREEWQQSCFLTLERKGCG